MQRNLTATSARFRVSQFNDFEDRSADLHRRLHRAQSGPPELEKADIRRRQKIGKRAFAPDTLRVCHWAPAPCLRTSHIPAIVSYEFMQSYREPNSALVAHIQALVQPLPLMPQQVDSNAKWSSIKLVGFHDPAAAIAFFEQLKDYPDRDGRIYSNEHSN